MRVRFFGTRGSIPTPGRDTVRYGGNTACVEVRSNAGTLVLLDLGTGSFPLGQELALDSEPLRGHVLISHTHWDHIQGLPFFAPFFKPGNEWDVYAPRGLGASVRETLSGQMQYTYFPVTLEQLGATIHYHDLVEGVFRVGDIEIEARYLNHPALTLGYRLVADGVTVVYACDHEPYSPAAASGDSALMGQDSRHAAFLAGADLVIHDAQYLASEYAEKVGWGHSTVEYAVAVAKAGGVRRLALTHHDPLRHDDLLDEIGAIARSRLGLEADPMDVFAAAEGQVLELSASDHPTGGPDGRSAMATAALVGSSVLIASDDAERLADLAAIVRSDDVGVLTSSVEGAADAVSRLGPSLLVIEDNGDPGAIRRLCRTVRDLPGDVPIILSTSRPDPGSDGATGIDDRLVAPYAQSYARTRFRAWIMRTACRWIRAPIPADEVNRLAALHNLDILDTPPERRFDRLTERAARRLGAPIAAITLVDSDRQWFKSTYGLDISETPRDESFCAHVVADPAPFVVPDALLDPRFADNPEVVGAPHIRFYAGHPLVLSDGHCVGSLCIVDTRPRDLGPLALDQLRRIAESVVEEVERPRPAGGADGS